MPGIQQLAVSQGPALKRAKGTLLATCRFLKQRGVYSSKLVVQRIAAMSEGAPDANGCSTSMRAMPPAAGRQLLSVAPMMDWTDVHYRQMARLISKHTWLWTEMVVDKTIIHNTSLDKFLWFPEGQRPLVFQLGGSDPQTLAKAAVKVAEYGYDEINLNCGCPSDRVAGAGCFGASLMLQPKLVADCMAAMAEAVNGTPVNVKCRLGVDEVDSYAQLCEFIKVVSENSPVTHFIIHARKCFLKGLNPHQNRTVPPLRHDWVWSLRADFPHLQFSINGGIMSSYEARAALRIQHPRLPDGDGIEGVMIGRAAYNDPWGCLGDADRAVFGAERNAAVSRRQVLEQYKLYADAVVGKWDIKSDGHRSPSVRTVFKPLLNLFHGAPGCKKWKNAVDALLKADPATVSEVLDKSLHLIPDAVLDAPPSEPVLEEVDAQPHWSLATLDFPQPVARAGVNQTPVGAAARAAALAEQAAEEAEAAAKAQAAGGAPAMAVAGCGEGLGAEGEGVSACAMEAMMEEQAEAVEAKKEKKQKAACVVS